MNEMFQPINIEIIDKATKEVIKNCRQCKMPDTGEYIKTPLGKRKVVERYIKMNNDVKVWVL